MAWPGVRGREVAVPAVPAQPLRPHCLFSVTEDEQRTNMTSQKNLQQLTMEKDQALADLNSVERSLSDLFRRYENLKGVLEGFKKVLTLVPSLSLPPWPLDAAFPCSIAPALSPAAAPVALQSHAVRLRLPQPFLGGLLGLAFLCPLSDKRAESQSNARGGRCGQPGSPGRRLFSPHFPGALLQSCRQRSIVPRAEPRPCPEKRRLRRAPLRHAPKGAPA